ncbi:ftcd: glutamate formiminotransferase [Lucifera butyrica]|uniref:glutamate formimidoyltransferase n=1 Tax=Lucifera butyrica TaxID=1351585 RepID=A0A498R7R2_9FIRM|nr:glutamate formimidoyltransferase [Lucifera butyrica]VBB05168.1 ftcd: glutamate formiminotransferase [Lucifera butyrica]
MAKLVECIPNFSEGRRTTVIEAIAGAIKEVPGVILLDYSADASHNRSVFTLVGTPEQVKKAVLQAAQQAVNLIDMTQHRGEHPRMGAVDVIPFVPIQNVTMDECVILSREAGAAIARELGMPVFLYEESATAASRKNLAEVRRGEFEGMAEKMQKTEWRPDFGDKLHPTAGAVAVGARMPLIAYNINLNTSDLNIAKAIAKIIRESSGGLKFVKALGVMLEDRNLAQVSINMTNYEQTPLYRVLELVKAEAKRYGVGVVGTEIIGLTPAKALVDSAKYYLQLEGFDGDKQVLENHLLRSNNG